MARGYDVRAIANLVLEEVEKVGRGMTNLHLNKTLYFMHVEYLACYSKPLLSAKIEAWEYGPVFREVYGQFKTFGRNEILGRAMKVDFDSGEPVIARVEVSEEEETFLKSLVRYYSEMPASLLVEMSHEKGGAWDKVWNHKEEINAGMEITTELIIDYEVPKHKNKRIS